MPAQQIYEFGHFRIDPEERLLLRDGKPVPLTPKAFDTLVLLVENHGHLMKKDELMRRVWPDAFVEEVNLAQNISAIRRALDSNGEQYIETVPKAGYRLNVNVRVLGEPGIGPGTSQAPPGPRGVAPPSERGSQTPKDANKKRVVTIALVAVALLGLATLIWRLSVTPTTGKAGAVHIASVAVLPLENLSRDPEQEYFADGMTDELITDLAKIHSLRVISRNSVMHYKGKHVPIPQIGRELNVDAVIEGTVTRSGNRVRITAQLIETQSDHHLWAQAYEGDARDVLILQDQVAQAIAAEIKVKVAPEEKTHLGGARVVNPEAHEADLRGFYELHKHGAAGTFLPAENEVERAIKFFQQALSIDPNDALAYAGLADAYYDQSTFFRAPLEVMPKAKAAAMRAIDLDDSLAEAHAALGYVKLTFDWDWPGAEKEFRRALELNENLASAHAGYAHYLLTLGRSEDSLRELEALKSVDPLFPQSHVGLPYTLWNLRRYEEAIQAAGKEGDERVIALSDIEEGRTDEAIAAADRGLKVARNPVILAQLAYVYAQAGRKDKAKTMLRGLEAQAKQRYICGFNMACLYMGLGDKETAYAWLDRAYRDRSD
ncbi:MAG TPA: winged helix-turn-helix domain-containing protein [Terriglobales bacterium]|jgi:TolB-like protein/DNA-binding winged helix-turn-helix (wHTH) protein/Flp pilus assembly protein TadD|nr:winged helix-turn-helix domain-containing protein [Terriglobales bacterium]